MGCTIGTLNLRSQNPHEDEEYGAGSTKNVLMQDQQYGVKAFVAAPNNKRQRQLKVQKSEDGDCYSNWQDASGKRLSKELVIESRDRMCQYIPEKVSLKDRSYLQSPVKKGPANMFSERTGPKSRSLKRKLARDNNEYHPSLYSLPRAQMITLADFD